MRAELDDALPTLAQYTDYPGVWGGLSSVHAGGASTLFAPDMSSKILLLLNAAGGVEQASLYGAFGVPLAGATASPLGFGGGLGDFDDGLDRLYVRARHYRPGLGAWMSRDPRGGLHGTYGYVSNSPVRLVDPSGLSSWDYWKAYGRALLEGDTWSQGLSTGMAAWSHSVYDTLSFGFGDEVLARLGLRDVYNKYKCEPGYRGAHTLGTAGMSLLQLAQGAGAFRGIFRGGGAAAHGRQGFGLYGYVKRAEGAGVISDSAERLAAQQVWERAARRADSRLVRGIYNAEVGAIRATQLHRLPGRVGRWFDVRYAKGAEEIGQAIRGEMHAVEFGRVRTLAAGAFPPDEEFAHLTLQSSSNWYARARSIPHESVHIGAWLNGQKDIFLHELLVTATATPEILALQVGTVAGPVYALSRAFSWVLDRADRAWSRCRSGGD